MQKIKTSLKNIIYHQRSPDEKVIQQFFSTFDLNNPGISVFQGFCLYGCQFLSLYFSPCNVLFSSPQLNAFIKKN